MLLIKVVHNIKAKIILYIVLKKIIKKRKENLYDI